MPAECIEYLTPLAFSRRWTSAISADTEADGVPMGMRQKSAVHLGGVPSWDMADDDSDMVIDDRCLTGG